MPPERNDEDDPDEVARQSRESNEKAIRGCVPGQVQMETWNGDMVITIDILVMNI